MKRHVISALLRLTVFVLLSGASRLWAEEVEPEKTDSAARVRAAMEASEALESVPFREVVLAATGHKVLAVSPAEAEDRALMDHLSKAADAVVTWLNSPESPVRGLARINEASRLVEDRLRLLLNTGDFSCDFPRPAKGKTGTARRSGYPDLRLLHRPSGRVTYLDPKLFEAKSRRSSLRTFYYEPRSLTGKITEDARHVLLGISHNGEDGAWTFQNWELLDLHDFQVRLKAEFQGSNRDLYRSGLILRSSSEAGAGK